MTKKRRQYGSGSVHRRQRDGLWVGTIEAGYTATGGRRRITVTGRSEAAAKSRLKERLRAIDRAESAGTRTTVKAWSVTWLAMTARTSRPKTHVTDRGAVGKWIVPTIGHKRLDQLTPADIRAVATAVMAEHTSTTALRYAGVLRRMLKAALDEGHPVPPRVLAVRPPAKAVNDRRAISTPEALALMKAAGDLPHGSRWLAAFLYGLRQGEALGLTWDMVGTDTITVAWQLQAVPYADKKDRRKGFAIPDGYEARQVKGRLHLVRPKSKAGWRVMPLLPVVATALEQWRAKVPDSALGLVWPAEDGSPREARADRDEWVALQTAAGVAHPTGRPYKGHEARHATATLLMELGVPESVRIAIMGHSSIAVTHGYEHVDVSLARDALARVAERLELK